MNEDRLAELKEKYKGRSLKNELVWGMYANHSGYVSKATGEFVNWLCYKAYEALYEKANGEPQGEWINQDKGAFYPIECSVCHTPPPCDEEDYFLTNFCPNCGARMKGVDDE